MTQRTAVIAAADEGSRGGLRLLEWTGKLVPQGLLVKGAKAGWHMLWQTFMQELAPQSKDGEYVRPSYGLRGTIGSEEFPVEAGRYAVYIGNACPWCHRVLLALIVRGLLPSVTLVNMTDDPERASRGGWVFEGPDPIFGCSDLREVYEICQPGYRGRCTAPLVVDRLARRLVSNESSDIVRNLNSVQLLGASDVDLVPAALEREIDQLNDLVYNQINNGVYKSGFATSQVAYDRAQTGLYAALNHVESLLASSRFLLGDKFTEADLRLYPTVVRYDSVYATLFRCPRQRITDLPNLSRWRADVFSLATTSEGMQIRDSFDLQQAMRSYFVQLFPLNPSGILPSGPTMGDLGLTPELNSAAKEPFHRRP